MIGTTLCFDGLGSLILYVNGDQAPDRGEWKAYVEFIAERTKLHSKARLLVVAGSGAPDAVQRKQIADAVTTKQVRSAVVSDSMVARGIVTAFRWYGLELDSFKVDAIGDAFRYLSATPDEIEWLQRTLTAMRTALALPRASVR